MRHYNPPLEHVPDEQLAPTELIGTGGVPPGVDGPLQALIIRLRIYGLLFHKAISLSLHLAAHDIVAPKKSKKSVASGC